MKYNETINFEPICTNNIILAYRNGIFPMAENEDSPDIFWVEPKRRGIIDIKGISINRKLKKLIKQNIYDVRINTNFKKVIEENKIVLFMKGTKEMPVCGFSKTVVSVLDHYGVDFHDVNILGHEDMRPALAELSGWPTFPQLFVNGKLLLKIS